ncbi:MULTISPECIES: isoaspartyl peptidase/L-asparaginase [unclassified Streptomyces]|uniref:isoaspartyl peptidase/L-asparaginase family protein n=1 Tax=unclassified Streptomyces TaxID=2593676 RepID=UPI002DD9659B|nr:MULTISPECIES: isoaspartyl peptidase/L-asparaginase [unclassified Streptomyces]WSA91009.1 isoaspartyl peptidase/L-asparaginase [Streptomyces sp. NBC_01795]WSB75334.1 isoaspartyl peptidase/L-asparaginase [Streptomyces sp. NBC_01775]WSS45201.1 isoaspartyl peptidase/L-asparaginase [Streptomyces sp. NBC_01187]
MRIRPRSWLFPALATATTLTVALVVVPRQLDPDDDGTPAASAAAPAAQAAPAPAGKAKPDARDVVLAVHGGAGTALSRDETSPEQEKAYRDGLARALRAGKKVLDKGGTSTRAVEKAVNVLEDDPLFNAGKGAVFTADAGHELDASIMRGSDLAAGAVAGVKHVRNPITAARLVMDKTKHVLLAGQGADDFAVQQGLKPVTQDYYWTQRRWDELMKAKGHQPVKDTTKGTVGAVAVDGKKDLSAATSTGGLTNKMAGRVGDSPVIGAGTYAKNSTVAASATGQGEVFIRGAATATISNLMEFGGKDLAKASYEVLVERLPKLGGDGGVIALDGKGTFDAPHSSEGMLHGYLTRDGKLVTKIFKDESPPNS